MGAAASISIDQDALPSAHQMAKMKEHLSTVPTGVDSYGKVSKVRLVRKRKFMEHPLILQFLHDLKLVLENVYVGLKVNGTGLGGTEVFHTSVTGMKEIPKTMQKLVEQRDQLRTELENLLFWRNDDDVSEKSQLFELFDLETCPPFTFISHRWAPEGRALGLHNELIGVLAMSKQEYIWLDCSCALQDAESFANGDCLKIIWNIGQLLDRATDILTYYATDGLHAPLYSHDLDTNTASDGLCRLYELACGADSSKLNSPFLNENAMRSAKGGTRLWCCFEFCCGRQKVLSPTALAPYVTPPDQSSEVQSVQSSYSSYHSKIYRHNALHNSMFISLDCYAASDVEPVTTIMYREKKLPCMLTSTYPMCWCPQKERTVHGFLLPVLTAQMDDEREAATPGTDRFGLAHVTTVTTVATNNGWYLDPDLNTYYFNCIWPQNKSIPQVKLQVHVTCLLASPGHLSSGVWEYDMELIKDHLYNLCMPCDRVGKTGHNQTAPCILCLKVKSTEAAGGTVTATEDMRTNPSASDIKEVTREGVMDPTTPPSEASNNIPSVPMAGTTVLPDHADATSDYHTVKLLGCWLLLPKRYTYIKAIGRGSYSVAVLAYDTFKKKNVCIKTYKRVFEDVQDALTTLSEVHVRRLLNHENIHGVLDIVLPPGVEGAVEDLCIVEDYFPTDLHRLIGSKQVLTVEHIQYFMYQILRGLKYLHSAKLIHRDIKPSNLFVQDDCSLVIGDFNAIRAEIGDDQQSKTEYVVTRWYRAPEVMASETKYSYGVDIWSVGCVMFELMNRKPFAGGSDYVDQMRLIVAKLGRPSREDLASFLTSQRAINFISNLPDCVATPFSELCPQHANETNMLDFLSQLLQFNPLKRMTTEQALRHPFLAELHNPDDEPVYMGGESGIDMSDFVLVHGDDQASRQKVQNLYWSEVQACRENMGEK